jgi:hypothetical protein
MGDESKVMNEERPSAGYEGWAAGREPARSALSSAAPSRLGFQDSAATSAAPAWPHRLPALCTQVPTVKQTTGASSHASAVSWPRWLIGSAATVRVRLTAPGDSAAQ